MKDNHEDKIARIIQYLNFLEKEILDRLDGIEKHLGIKRERQITSPEPPAKVGIEEKVELPPSPALAKATFVEPVSIPSMVSPPPTVCVPMDIGTGRQPREEPAEQPRQQKEILDIESRIGTKYFNWIGVIVLILGIAFFLKYAIDNQWVGETGRVIIGIIIGLGLIVGGHYSAGKKYKIPAWGLMAGGLAILYLSIYAGFGYYHLIPQALAFAFMILVTITGITLSVRYDAKSLAVLALIGGFLTPVLMSTGKDNQIALFSYIVLLDIGILITAYFKKWRLLDYLAFVLTVIMFFGWYGRHYTEAKLFGTIFFLSVFFIIFAFLSFFHNIIHRKKTGFGDLVMLLGTPSWYFGTSYGLLHHNYVPYMGLYALLMVGIYLSLARLAQTRNKEDRYLILVLLGIALTFLTLTVPIQLEHKWITIAWAVEASILVWLSFQTRSLATRIGGLLIVGLLLIRLMFIESANIDYGNFVVILNERFLTFIISLNSIFSITYLYFKHKDSLHPDEQRVLPVVLTILTILIGFWIINMETMSYYNYSEWGRSVESDRREGLMQRTLSIGLTLYAFILVVIGIRGKISLIRWSSFILFAATIIKVLLYDLAELEPVYRITSFIVLGVILIAVSFLYQKFIKRIR
ncbi:MAG: DUF2339 domain-containing protein [Planctomycetota bacterium]|nr:DUF2339 domain-containing protein [Planctomycetota bacterium]MDI6787460.1 DUF2339 domain-containing protein [Planctomycetota bacterium]